MSSGDRDDGRGVHRAVCRVLDLGRDSGVVLHRRLRRDADRRVPSRAVEHRHLRDVETRRLRDVEIRHLDFARYLYDGHDRAPPVVSLMNWHHGFCDRHRAWVPGLLSFGRLTGCRDAVTRRSARRH